MSAHGEPDASLLHEAERIGIYLLREPPQPQFRERYRAAISIRPPESMSPFESALWRRALRSTFQMKLIDAGLALRAPHSPIRQRILIMLAILEASPVYAERFLPRNMGWPGLLSIGLLSCRMIVASLIGSQWIALLRHRGIR